MTDRTAFTDEEWEAIREGPSIAGMLVLTAEGGGSFRESFALAKTYAEARQAHGQNELLDEIVAEKPTFDRHKYGSAEALQQGGLERLSEAGTAIASKGTEEDATAYRIFVLDLARRVASAHKEHGQEVSPREQEALDAISVALPIGAEPGAS